MKKLFAGILALALGVTMTGLFAACETDKGSGGSGGSGETNQGSGGSGETGQGSGGGENGGGTAKTYTVYAPDGAPALALANAIACTEGDAFEYHIVASSTITARVTGEDPEADFCILPVNAAAKLLGTGETYQMLGTVTNGNMYLLTTGDAPAIEDADDLSHLVGKTVGVVQLTNVPGLTFRCVLEANDIDYQILGNDTAAAADKVNLKAIQDASTGVVPNGGCDYYLCPEPAASAKIKGTQNKPVCFRLAGSLQTLYGENGYPQAVMVAKKSVIDSDAAAVGKMLEYMRGSAAYLGGADAAYVVELLDGHYTDGMTPSLNANNLTKEVIANCSVGFTEAKDCKARVNAFLAELIAVSPDFTKTVADAFYYAG